ncbi:MAG: hypothetical protein ACOC00_06235, partial [Halothiobacillaceae bacterium]
MKSNTGSRRLLAASLPALAVAAASAAPMPAPLSAFSAIEQAQAAGNPCAPAARGGNPCAPAA